MSTPITETLTKLFVITDVLLTKRLQFVPGQPLPRPLVVKEQDEIVGSGVRVCEVEDLLRRDRDGDTVVEVSRPWHLGVDDEGRVPGVSSALGPHQVQGLQLNVGRGDARIALGP